MPKRAPAYMDEQRDDIASAVFELLKENSLHAVTLRKICTRAGISMGTFYIYFDSKEDAIDAAIFHYMQGGETPPIPESWDQLEALFYTQRHRWDDDEAVNFQRLGYETVALMLSRPQDHWKSADYVMKLNHDWWRETLNRLEKNGDIRLSSSAETVARHLTYLHSGAVYTAVYYQSLRTEEAFEEVMQMTRQLLGRAECGEKDHKGRLHSA